MRRQEAIDPAEVNVDPARLKRAEEVLGAGIAEGAMPGAVVCALRRGQVFLHEALGTLDGQRPTARDTVYDLASLTKPMATAASVLSLVERGQLTLKASLADLLGKQAAAKGDITVLHLLTHTSGLPAWTPLYERSSDRESAVQEILSLPTERVGTHYEYTCLGFILLAHVVEKVTGRPFDRVVRESVLEPLELHDTGFLPESAKRDRIAPTITREKTADDGEDERTLVGIVHDGNARSLGGVSGNAGLFGTARDVAAFGDAVRQGGACRQRLFGSPTVSRILTSQIEPAVGAHTLMFFAQGNALCPSGDLLSPRTIGHSGFTGTILTLDPEYDLTVAVLTNRVLTDPNGSRWLAVRRRFLNALAAAIC